MIGLEIVLLIVGFACVCISFFVARNKQDESVEDGEGRASAVWTEKEEQMIRDRVNDILEERQNELVDSTEDKMNRLCNDKIMAVDEFSRQILEKIENNHQEVVFMYNMLNEKEKDVKKVVIEPVRKEVPKAEPIVVQAQQTKEKATQAEPIVKSGAKQEPTALEKMQMKKEESIKVASPVKEEPVADTDDVNAKIRKMYKEGKSVLEISKELNIGQGEVKLIIALYGGKK